MSFILDGSTLRRPHEISESNNTQVAVQRTLSGAVNRDLFGSNNQGWRFNKEKTQKTD